MKNSILKLVLSVSTKLLVGMFVLSSVFTIFIFTRFSNDNKVLNTFVKYSGFTVKIDGGFGLSYVRNLNALNIYLIEKVAEDGIDYSTFLQLEEDLSDSLPKAIFLSSVSVYNSVYSNKAALETVDVNNFGKISEMLNKPNRLSVRVYAGIAAQLYHIHTAIKVINIIFYISAILLIALAVTKAIKKKFTVIRSEVNSESK